MGWGQWAYGTVAWGEPTVSIPVSAPEDRWWTDGRAQFPQWPFVEEDMVLGYINNPNQTYEKTITHTPCGHWHKKTWPYPDLPLWRTGPAPKTIIRHI